MITVVHCKKEKSTYIGRPSVLGNPFAMRNESERNNVVEKYEEWLREKIKTRDKEILHELRRLRDIALNGDLKLGCWCAPRACHGDVIKKVIERNIKNK